MRETTAKDLQSPVIHEMPDPEANMEIPAGRQAKEPRTSPGDFRQAAYVVLFIAAVFVINAMETGSYRTPWPVALGTVLVGLGLLGYSWYLQSRSD
jgi:protein-S-isoprenylcysteine O-methyltransferase Ste14